MRTAAQSLFRFIRHEPLILFCVVAGLVFWVAPRSDGGDEVHISRTSLRSLEEAEARRRRVDALPDAVARAVRQQAIDDELLYHEGLRLGLDKNDNIVRQRVIEKMMFLGEDLAGASHPVSDAELERWLDKHRDRFVKPALVSFIHVFSASDGARLAGLRATLPAGVDGAAAEPPPVGDAFPIGRRIVHAPLVTLERSWGAPFVRALESLPTGQWSEPLQSRYGFHLVKVLARSDGTMPTLDAVRAAVRSAYLEERKARADAELLRAIRARYDVRIDDRADAIPVGGAAVNGAPATREAD